MKYTNMLLIAGLSFVFLSGCDKTPTRPSSVNKDWEVVCVEGYQYIYRNEIGSYKGFIAPKFNEEGKPDKCDPSTFGLR